MEKQNYELQRHDTFKAFEPFVLHIHPRKTKAIKYFKCSRKNFGHFWPLTQQLIFQCQRLSSLQLSFFRCPVFCVKESTHREEPGKDKLHSSLKSTAVLAHQGLGFPEAAGAHGEVARGRGGNRRDWTSAAAVPEGRKRSFDCTCTYWDRAMGIWGGQQEILHLVCFCLGSNSHRLLTSHCQIFCDNQALLLFFQREGSVLTQEWGII